MAEAEYRDVRVEESLRVKIGEVKNLPASSFSGSGRNTCCAIKIDSEEIFRTSTVEKSLDPFFGAEFQGEIPKKFRYLSFYVYEVGNKNKVLGKVSLKKEELYKYHQKEHWFPLTYQDGDTEVQGKVQVEVRLDEFLAPSPSVDTTHRMVVRVLECSDLTVINGSCNPYAVVSLSYGKAKAKEVRRTAVKKKTICPQFEETFLFQLENKGQNSERSQYFFDDFRAGELSVSLFHDDSKVSREVLGNIFKGHFLGEVKIPINDIEFSSPHRAWYCLQAKESNRTSDQFLGSIRLRISYSADYVFPSKYYDGLRDLILQSAEKKPFTSSAAFILGEIVKDIESAAQPLVKLFLHHGKLVPLIHALADWEMSNTVDPNTLFRGNSLLTKMVDELMKLMGMPYLHDTLKSFVDQVISEGKPCEIDPTRVKEGEDLTHNLNNLFGYVNDAFNTITNSGLVCPSVMRDVFSTLKSRATLNYPENVAVRYHAVTSFIFLRFFTAAIMGPNLFDLYSDIPDALVQRTFTLISKGISGLVNLVSSKSNNITSKEEYMAPLFALFPKSVQADIKMFLDLISSSSGCQFKGIEAPIVLKEGFLIKRAQGRKRFGLKNFKKRVFRLSNQSLSYSKNKGDKALFEIPITDILAVEKLEEESFKMKYMFQVVHAERALYIQASNCVEEKEWLNILMKICKSNKNRLKVYHPAAFVNNHWLCCKSTDPAMPGCKPVTGGLPLTDIQGDIDSDREVEKIHSLFLTGIEMLDALQGFVDEDDLEYDEDEMCGTRAVYAGDPDMRSQSMGANIEDPSSCFATIAEIQRCIITLEQEHIQYMRSVQRKTVIGSIDTPIGDESGADLVRNMNRSSERLSRHGSRSSNASNISRRSFRGSRSRGGSFREREKGKMEGEGVRKSLSGDVVSSTQSLGVAFKSEVKKAASYDVMAVESTDGERHERKRTVSGGSDRDAVDTGSLGSYLTDSPQRMLDASAALTVNNGLSPTHVPVPRKSTGFIPSGVFGDNNSDIVSGETSGQLDNSSITTNGQVVINSDDASFLSISSQNVGVLETSLDSNDIITTSLSMIDAKDLPSAHMCHSADISQSATNSQHLHQSEVHQDSSSKDNGQHTGDTSPESSCPVHHNLPAPLSPSMVEPDITNDQILPIFLCDEKQTQAALLTRGSDSADSGNLTEIFTPNKLADFQPPMCTDSDKLDICPSADVQQPHQLDTSEEEKRDHFKTLNNGFGNCILTSEPGVHRSLSEPCSNADTKVRSLVSSYSESTTRQLSVDSAVVMPKISGEVGERQSSADHNVHCVTNSDIMHQTVAELTESRDKLQGLGSSNSHINAGVSLGGCNSDRVDNSLPELTSAGRSHTTGPQTPPGTMPPFTAASSNSTPTMSPITTTSVDIMQFSTGSEPSQGNAL